MGSTKEEKSLSDILNIPESELGSQEGSLNNQEDIDNAIVDSVLHDVNTVKSIELLGMQVRRLRLADLAILIKAKSSFVTSVDLADDPSQSVLEISKVLMLLDYNKTYEQSFSLANLDQEEMNSKCLDFCGNMSFSSIKGYTTAVTNFLATAYANQPVVIDNGLGKDDTESNVKVLVGDEKGKDSPHLG